MSQSSSPNFFILGAPKCGTTALASYLDEHPDIEISTPKEPHYFATDLNVARVPAANLAEYERMCFTDRAVAARGDASVWHLYSQDAVPRILEAYPEARFIVMLRHPIEMAHALHSQHVFFAREDQHDFDTAWHLSEKRRNGENLPPHPEPRCVLYDQIASFGEQISRLFSYVDKENVLIITNEDMNFNIHATYQAVLNFLRVEDDHRRIFSRINESRRIRRDWMVRILRSRLVFHTAVGMKSILGLQTLGIGKPQPLLQRVDRDRMLYQILEDIEFLELLIERKLDAWQPKSNKVSDLGN